MIEEFINNLRLGDITSLPIRISGGLLHKMFAVETTTGKYAIKVLNPNIMKRHGVIQKLIDSERIAGIAATSINALPAMIIDNKLIHEHDGQFFLIFNWVDGRRLVNQDITVYHCNRVGRLLAELHSIDFSSLMISNEESNVEKTIDFSYYLEKGKESEAEWRYLLENNIDLLHDCDMKAKVAADMLSTNMIISHRDMDPKNILWEADEPIVIDWEAAGYINPMYELMETALYWAENSDGSTDRTKFLKFIRGYESLTELQQADWNTVLDYTLSGRLGWLEYNLKRSLMIECGDEEEQRLGTFQVIETINSIINYADMITTVVSWMDTKNSVDGS